MISQAGRPKVLTTRSHEGNIELAEKLQALGFEPLSIDVLELSSPDNWSLVDSRLRELHEYDWLLLTSATGARLFAERARALNIDPGKFRTKVAVVGTKTATTLAQSGWRIDFVPSRFLSEALGRELPSGKRALFLRSDIAGRQMVMTLRARGFEVDEAIIYRTVRRVVKDVEVVRNAEIIVFGSPSAVEGLCSQLPPAILTALTGKEAACIGPVTANAARARGFTRIIECKTTHTFDSLLEEVRRTYHVA